MTGNILDEILAWSTERPAWQRDALRRLFTVGTLTLSDLDELTTLCKAGHGLAAPGSPDMLATSHLAIPGGMSAEPVTLASVTHHRGVNALAPEQTVAFGSNLTIVFGQNAAGKSGYTRILKRACRSRFTEDVLGNVLSGEKPLKGRATIRFREGTTETPFDWAPSTPPAGPLAAISVFDAHCAPVYLRDKTDVAFRPFGLDIFDRLAAVCAEIRKRLETERATLNATPSALPELASGTQAKLFVDNLTSLTKPEALAALTTLSNAEERRLKELRDRVRDLRASDPTRTAKELTLKAQRFEAVATHIGKLAETFSDAALEGLRSFTESLRVAQQTLELLRKTVITPGLLTGTGEATWRAMWEAAQTFSKVAYPKDVFPVLSKGARCPLCQQDLGPDVASRLRHFHEYVSSTAQAEVRSAEAAHRKKVAGFSDAVIEREDQGPVLAELVADEPDLGQGVRNYLRDARRCQERVALAISASRALPTAGLPGSPEAEIRAAAKVLRDRATQLRAQASPMEAKSQSELTELESRVLLRTNQQAVLQDIERRKRLAAYSECLDDTSTQAITRKSSELTKRLVTDQLRSVFQDELAKLKFTDLAVEIQSAGGTRGALFHHLVFTGVPGVAVTDVLSEGESRALSLAAFLTELSTSTTRSAIIFDDPVSSLDHIWRERIAARLVAEAQGRQVIVFTHDLFFLRTLEDEAARVGVPCEHQYVRREGHEAGICAADLPWVAMVTRKRIAVLHNRWQAAEKIARDSGKEAYERDARDIYGLLRETWEQALSEVLLADVVARYRFSIETRKARVLHDITKEDCDALDEGMSDASRWMRGHDQPLANGTPFPSALDLKKRIDDLDAWVSGIVKRRRG